MKKIIFKDNFIISDSRLGILNAVVTGLVLLGSIKISILNIGLSLFGFWTLIQTAISIARLPEYGVVSTITRNAAIGGVDIVFVSDMYAAIGSVFFQTVVVMCIAVPAFLYFMPSQLMVLEGVELYSVVFLAACAALIFSASMGMGAYLDGLGLIRKRFFATITVYLLSPVWVYWLTYDYGIIGLAVSQFVLSTLLLFLYIFGAYQQLRKERFSFLVIAVKIKLILNKSKSLSATGVLRAGFEPLTKFAISMVVGLNGVAAFDIALKITTQIRAVVQGGMQSLLPMLSKSVISENLFSRAQDFEEGRRRVAKLSKMAAYIFFVLAISSPLHGKYLIGGDVVEYVSYFCILSVGSLINLMGLLGYYLDMAKGGRGVVMITYVMFVTNVGLIGLGSYFSSGEMVATSYAATFIVGGIWGLLKQKVESNFLLNIK